MITESDLRGGYGSCVSAEGDLVKSVISVSGNRRRHFLEIIAGYSI
jgi:hypothetical protein